MNIAFIGLGIMGRPMAKNLLKAGHVLRVYDIVPEFVAELQRSGATGSASASEAAQGAELVFTMLPSSAFVLDVVLGDGGVLAALRPGAIVCDTSSIAPADSRQLAAKCAEKGVHFLDCPVSGGEPKAIDGTLYIMCGGDLAAFERVRPVLADMAASVLHVGGPGSGSIAKLANQVMVAANICGMAEALMLATKAGVDPEKVYQAVRGGLAGSAVLDAKAPMVLARDFVPGGRMALHAKDLRNAVAAAADCGSPAPLSELILGMMRDLDDLDLNTIDHGGLALYYERLAGMEIHTNSKS